MRDDDTSILIVDDEPDLAEILCEDLGDEGFRAAFKTNAVEALEYFNGENVVNVIISDSKMPGMNGLEFLEALKSSGKEMPLFYLCTGDPNLSDKDIIEKGGTGLIAKPYSVDEVVSRIKKDVSEK